MAAPAESAASGTEVSGLDYEETELKLALPGAGAPGRLPGAEGDRKRGFQETTAHLRLGGGGGGLGRNAPAGTGATQSAAESRESKVTGSANPPASKAQVVGWPPVRASMRNALKPRNFVKVAVDGAPYLRKVDLELYNTYDQLLAALEEMFSCFTIRNYLNEGKLVDPVNGTEFVPTYKDKEGDWMLVGDVPWKMFVETCKRLRLMKSSEAVNLAPRTPEGSSNAG